MKNICIITQCSLPVPTVKGGAVETLVEFILKQNEIKGKYNFTVISVADDSAKKIATQYKHADFVWIPLQNKTFNKGLMLCYRILKHLGVYIPFSLEFRQAIKTLKTIKEHDLYLYEAGPTTQLLALAKIVPKEKLLVHLHWDGMGNKRKDRCFSYLLPVSDYIGERWCLSSGCLKNKIMPLYNCTNIDLFQKKISDVEKHDLRKQFNIPEENKIVIFIGRIVEEKGIKELLKAFQLLEHENVTLLVIGSANFGAKTRTPYEVEVEKFIQQSNKSIVFTGFVHQTELYKYYNIADLAVMPSMFQDPAPLVCIEAQATGTPLIATDVGGIKEYADEKGVILIKKDGNLIPNLAKAIDGILDDPIKAAQMGRYCEEHAQQFDVKKYYDNFSRIIDEILKSN